MACLHEKQVPLWRVSDIPSNIQNQTEWLVKILHDNAKESIRSERLSMEHSNDGINLASPNWYTVIWTMDQECKKSTEKIPKMDLMKCRRSNKRIGRKIQDMWLRKNKEDDENDWKINETSCKKHKDQMNW